MPNADDMLAVAAARADELAAPGLDPRPRRKVAVLACMDTRIDLFPMLGLERGDAHIIRNAGGLVTDDAIRSLAASQRLLGTEEIVVVMHDGCGLHGASEDEFARRSPTTASSPPGASAHSTTSMRRCAKASPACERAQSYPPATRSAASSSTRRPENCARSSPGEGARLGGGCSAGAVEPAPTPAPPRTRIEEQNEVGWGIAERFWPRPPASAPAERLLIPFT